jgi:FkbM family methyltransferase
LRNRIKPTRIQMALSFLSRGYFVESNGKLLCFVKNPIKITGPFLSLMEILKEDFEETYSVDCKDKVVLDVGGFIGETAVLFLALGASKVVIYEPVAGHQEYIKLNMAINGINAEIHDEGIGKVDGYDLIKYDALDVCFGLRNSGQKQRKIKIKNVRRVIEESGANIAKFDCEGAENSLLGVPGESLRRIGFYIIEVHTPKIKEAIENKFKRSGFNIVRHIPNKGDWKDSTIFFQRN